jgi:hypothetical protein
MCTFYNRNSPSFILGDFHCWMKHSVRYDRPVCLTQSFALNSSFLSRHTIFGAGSFRHTHPHTHTHTPTHTILCCLSEREDSREQSTLSVRVLVLASRDLLANSSGCLQARTCSWEGIQYALFSPRIGELLQLCQPVLSQIADVCFDFKLIIMWKTIVYLEV